MYEVTELDDGSLLLTPVVVMSTAERDLLAGPPEMREALAQTLAGENVATRHVSSRRPAHDA